MSIGKNLKRLRLEHNLSQGEVARIIGVTRPAYGFWENDKVKPKEDKLEKLAVLFGVAIDELTKDAKEELVALYDTLTEERQVDVLNYTREQKQAQIQEQQVYQVKELFSTREIYPNNVYEKLSAGTGFGYFGDGAYDVVYSDQEFDYDFASWIYGDSMEPEYINGSVALIRDTVFDYDGAVYAVEWDGQTYIKRVYKEENGLRLVSANPKYKDKFAPFDESPRIIGKIIGNFMPIDKEE